MRARRNKDRFKTAHGLTDYLMLGLERGLSDGDLRQGIELQKSGHKGGKGDDPVRLAFFRSESGLVR